MNRVILHVDMNAYFASVEQKANPLLRGKPILVVADSRRRSVVLTASYEARAFGVKTGMNLYEAKKFCPQAVAVDGNSDKYLDSSARLFELFASFTDQVEMVSCDEAFLDVTGSLKCFGTDGAGLARKVQGKVRSAIGLPCSVGVAPNKVLAKLASEIKKPNGVTVVLPGNVKEFLAEMPVEKISGVGRKLKEKLGMLGITTCGQLGNADIGFLENHFGVWAYWLKKAGAGLDDAPVRKLTDEDLPKSMGHSTTFPRDSSDPDILSSYLMLLSEKVAFRLRKKNLQGRVVSLTVRYKDFTGFGRQHKNGDYSNDGQVIHRSALRILESVKLAQSVRLLGVSVSDLIPALRQDYLFEDMARRKKLNSVMDRINLKFGIFTLHPASLGFAERFGILSPPIPPYVAARRLYD